MGDPHKTCHPHPSPIWSNHGFRVFDKDSDGVISKQEFIEELKRYFSLLRHPVIKILFSIDPDVNVTDELETFISYDLDRSGNLEYPEIVDWLIPSDFDPAEAEFKHLLHEADNNEDGKLDLEEILEKYEVLIDYQTTRWGRLSHDEL